MPVVRVTKQFTVPDPAPKDCPLKPGLYERAEHELDTAGCAYVLGMDYGVRVFPASKKPAKKKAAD